MRSCSVAVGVEESAQRWVVISALEVVEARLCIVVVAIGAKKGQLGYSKSSVKEAEKAQQASFSPGRTEALPGCLRQASCRSEKLPNVIQSSIGEPSPDRWLRFQSSQKTVPCAGL